MRNRKSSIFAIGLLALTMTACSETSNNTDACRELLNIQGELEMLVNDVPSNAEEVSAVLPRFVEISNEAKNVDADGDVKTAATSLGDAADSWRAALEAAVDQGAFDDPISSSLAATYVEAELDVNNACNQFLP